MPKGSRARTSVGSRAAAAARLSGADGEANDVPRHLHIYAPAALALYTELDGAEGELQREARRDPFRRAAIALPALHWDTSVLDVDEDRVIWVRESDLGRQVQAQP